MTQKRGGTGEPSRVVLHDPRDAVGMAHSDMPHDVQGGANFCLSLVAVSGQELIQQKPS